MDTTNARSATTKDRSVLLVQWLPVVCGVVPVVISLTCYAISSRLDLVPDCFVFTEGCTSISAAGRQSPASYLFKGTLLPVAALIAVYWLLVGDWLRVLGARTAAVYSVRIIGIVGALFFILYVTFLGSDGDVYRLMRRYGVTVYFSFTVLAQMFLARAMLAVAPDVLNVVARWQLAICLVMLAIGLAVTLPEVAIDVPKRLENTAEWNFALLMHLNIVLTFFAWRRTGLRATLNAER